MRTELVQVRRETVTRWIDGTSTPNEIHESVEPSALGPGYCIVHTGAELDERWTEILGRKVWRNINTGETWVEEK